MRQVSRIRFSCLTESNFFSQLFTRGAYDCSLPFLCCEARYRLPAKAKPLHDARPAYLDYPYRCHPEPDPRRRRDLISNPRWWFDFARELVRFSARIAAYLLLLTDQYPSTIEEQAVHLEIDYPDAKRDLNRWLPLVKWLLAIPHYIVLLVLMCIALVAVVYAWFVILITGRYPRAIFYFVVGVGRWCLRVQAYSFLLVTDAYPPFSLS